MSNNAKKSMNHLAMPKSDQLNSEQLLGSPITVTVTKVVEVNNPQQPLIIHYAGENGRPYKPCKSMMKVLKLAWTEFYEDWKGKSMTLFCDPKVKWAGEEVGGIRISAMSHIEKEISVSLTTGKTGATTKKAPFVIKRLDAPASRDYRAELRDSKDMAATWKSFPAAVRAELESFKEELKASRAKPVAPAEDDGSFA